MENQKVCIIGGGLTGLITAIVLSKLNLKIDIITDNTNQNITSSRTTAISQHNYDFLKKLKIFKFSKKEFWPCSKMKLYTEDNKEKLNEIFKLEIKQALNNQILYMIKNSKITKSMIENIKKNKLISFKTQKTISEILPFGLLKGIKLNNKNYSYNLIIICTGSNSNLVKKIFNDRSFQHSYGEISISTVLTHSSLDNNIARQIFLDNEILALLPISNRETSIVWSVKKNIFEKYKKKNLFFKNKIKFYTKDFLKKVNFSSAIEYKNLNFLTRDKYYQDRILLFGDALHLVHPLVGQGFNMTLRDLSSLKKILLNRINLGLDVGSSDVLSEFSNNTKSGNFIYSLGIDFLKSCFSFDKKTFNDFRNIIVKQLDKNNSAKNIFFNLADKGIKF